MMTGFWGPNMTAALEELERRGFLCDRMSPEQVLEAINQVAGSCIPESEDPEKAAALWLAALREGAASER